MLRVVNRQIPLPGFAAVVADSFRFTWWNTREGAAVWIENRGRWRTGVVFGLTRKRAAIAIEAAGSKRLVVATPYSGLRRRQTGAR